MKYEGMTVSMLLTNPITLYSLNKVTVDPIKIHQAIQTAKINQLGF